MTLQQVLDEVEPLYGDNLAGLITNRSSYSIEYCVIGYIGEPQELKAYLFVTEGKVSMNRILDYFLGIGDFAGRRTYHLYKDITLQEPIRTSDCWRIITVEDLVATNNHIFDLQRSNSNDTAAIVS